MAILHSEIAASSESAGDSRATLAALQSELSPLVDDVTGLTLHLCATVGIQTGTNAGNARNSTGTLVNTDRQTNLFNFEILFHADVGSGPNSLASDVVGPASIGSEYNKENISPDSSVTVTPVQTPTRLLHILQEQVRMLVSDKDRDTFESDVAELQEQIVKLKGKFLLVNVMRR